MNNEVADLAARTEHHSGYENPNPAHSNQQGRSGRCPRWSPTPTHPVCTLCLDTEELLWEMGRLPDTHAAPQAGNKAPVINICCYLITAPLHALLRAAACACFCSARLEAWGRHFQNDF